MNIISSSFAEFWYGVLGILCVISAACLLVFRPNVYACVCVCVRVCVYMYIYIYIYIHIYTYIYIHIHVSVNIYRYCCSIVIICILLPASGNLTTVCNSRQFYVKMYANNCQKQLMGILNPAGFAANISTQLSGHMQH